MTELKTISCYTIYLAIRGEKLIITGQLPSSNYATWVSWSGRGVQNPGPTGAHDTELHNYKEYSSTAFILGKH